MKLVNWSDQFYGKFRTRGALNTSTSKISAVEKNLKAGARTVIRSEEARVGGITPWLKAAHLAETLGAPICRYFLIERQEWFKPHVVD